MNKEEALLWERLDGFELDDPNSDYTFSMRLANENEWKISFALRAIQEYKKFIFLACTAGHPVTPSDQVDQVWHLHLIYTYSYWKILCGQIIGKEIHHGPTPGGSAAKSEYADFYQKTLESYKLKFQNDPPKDIWPDSTNRFTDIHFRRVNIKRNWIIKRP